MPGGSSRTQTTVQQSQPWGPQALALARGFERAEDLYGQGPLSYYPGGTVAPFAPETSQALAMMTRMAGQGLGPSRPAAGHMQRIFQDDYPTSNPAFDYLGATARGDLLNANPYLDATFNQAARQVRDQVNATFGAAGRTGSGAHADVLSRNLGEVANDLYFRNYAQERANQLGAASRLASAFETARDDQLRGMMFAPQLEALQYLPAERLAQAGALRQAQSQAELQDEVNRYNFEQEAPYDLLARYMAFLGNPVSGMSRTAESGPAVNAVLSTLQQAVDLGKSVGLGGSIGGLLGLL